MSDKFFEIFKKHLTESYNEQYPDDSDKEKVKTLTQFDIDDARLDPSVKAILEYIDFKTGK